MNIEEPEIAMTIPLLKIKANQMIEGIFIYDPIYHEFHYVDEVDVEEYYVNRYKCKEIVIINTYFLGGKYFAYQNNIDAEQEIYAVLNNTNDDEFIINQLNKTKHYDRIKSIKYNKKFIKNHIANINYKKEQALD